jgi:hypothetical protein
MDNRGSKSLLLFNVKEQRVDGSYYKAKHKKKACN